MGYLGRSLSILGIVTTGLNEFKYLNYRLEALGFYNFVRAFR